jgi:uncharacterized protein YdbL (DUF1318 family)
MTLEQRAALDAAEWDGVPLNPERNGWHWLKDDVRAEPVATIWSAELGSWVSGAAYSPSGVVELGFCYLGPCHTPAEVAALIEAARQEEREANARIAEETDAGWFDTRTFTAQKIAAAIRARSTEEGA